MSRKLYDCMNARYPVSGQLRERIVCRAGHELPKIATANKSATMECRVCQSCLDFDDADKRKEDKVG
jgi:hypothetical protein